MEQWKYVKPLCHGQNWEERTARGHRISEGITSGSPTPDVAKVPVSTRKNCICKTRTCESAKCTSNPSDGLKLHGSLSWESCTSNRWKEVIQDQGNTS